LHVWLFFCPFCGLVLIRLLRDYNAVPQAILSTYDTTLHQDVATLQPYMKSPSQPSAPPPTGLSQNTLHAIAYRVAIKRCGQKAIVHALEAGMFIIRVVFAVQGTSRDDFTKLCKLAQDLY